MKILFATDGSTQAGRALEYLLALPLKARDEIRAVSVPVYLLAATPEVDSPPIAAAMRRRRAKAQAIATAAADRIGVRGLRASASAPEGSRAAAILREARTYGAALVVVGGGGLGRVRGALLGSTAADLLSGTTRPLLIVKGDPEPPRRVLVVRTDARRPGLAAALRRLLPLPAGAGVSLVPDSGADEVLEAAASAAADLIVFEARTRSAAEVARRASEPVLIGLRTPAR